MLADSFLSAEVPIYATSAISWGSVKCCYSYLMKEESRVSSPLSGGPIPTQLLLLNGVPGVLH